MFESPLTHVPMNGEVSCILLTTVVTPGHIIRTTHGSWGEPEALSRSYPVYTLSPIIWPVVQRRCPPTHIRSLTPLPLDFPYPPGAQRYHTRVPPRSTLTIICREQLRWHRLFGGSGIGRAMDLALHRAPGPVARSLLMQATKSHLVRDRRQREECRRHWPVMTLDCGGNKRVLLVR